MKTVWAFLLMSISLLSNAQTKINPARLLQGTSGSGSVFLKSDNSGNVSFSNNLNGGVLSGLGNGVLSSDAVNLGQADGRYGQLANVNTWTAINNFTSPIWVKGGSAAQTAIGFQNISTSIGMIGSVFNFTGNTADNSDFGDYVYGNNNYRLFTNGAERLRVAGSGNIGINKLNPLAQLHVEGTGSIFSVGGYNYASISQVVSSADAIFGGGVISEGTTGGKLKKISSDVSQYIRMQISDGIVFHTNITGAAGLVFDRTANEVMRINNSGNVGIGLSTTNDKLDVNGNITSRNTIKTIHTNSIKRNLSAYSIQQQVATVTGTLVIEMPIGFDSRFMSVNIKGFNYTSSTGIWETTLNLYNYGNSNPPVNSYWANSTGTVSGNPGFSSIRVGYNTTTNKCCIMLGTTTTTWNYPMIVLDITHVGTDNMDTGWSHSFVTTEGANYTNISSVVLNQNILGRLAGQNAIASNEFTTLTQLQNAANITTGTLPDSRLSSNIARISTNNQLRFSDTRNTNDLPQSRINGLYLDFKTSTTSGLSDGGGYNGIMTIRQYGDVATDWSGGLAHQIGFTDSGNMWHRNNTNATPNEWSSWQKFVLFNTDGTLSVATATSANHAVRLDQAQNASNLTTGTIPDARISTNIARVADLKLCNYTPLTLPTQSTDYTLNFNWDNYAQNTYGVDGTGFSGTNILISGSNPKTGGFYNVIITNCGGRNLVFSSKFKNFDGVALSTINATSAMRFKFVFNGTDYMRID